MAKRKPSEAKYNERLVGLIAAANAGDEGAKHEAVVLLLPWIIKTVTHALQRTPRHFVDDAVQVAVMALIESMPRYDPSQVLPQTYFFRRVRGAALDYVRSECAAHGVRRKDKGKPDQRRTYRISELEHAERAAFGFQRTCHTEEHFHTRDASPIADRDQFYGYIKHGFSQTERIILLLRYVEDATMREIGEQLGISESRISQILSGLSERLKRMIAKDQ